MATYEEISKYCKEHCFNNITRNFAICTESVYVDCKMYPKMILDIEFLVPVSVVVGCLFLTGLVANLCVCAVIMKHPIMRTDANIYLFSLAISDLFLLVFGLPPELLYYWKMHPYVLGDFTCRITTFMAATGTWASVLTIVAFSLERYEAICHPLRTRSNGSKRVAKAILAIWTISVATAIPILYLYYVDTTLIYPGTNNESYLSLTCSPDPKCKYCEYMYVITSVVFFFVPMVILALVYIKIALFLRSSSKLSRNCGIQNSCSENKRTLKVLVAVVASFCLCEAPFHYQRVAAPFVGKPQTQAQKVVDRYVLVGTGVFYYLSATVNPLLYNVMSKRYRKAFMEIIWHKVDTKTNDISLINSTKDTRISSKKSATVGV